MQEDTNPFGGGGNSTKSGTLEPEKKKAIVNELNVNSLSWTHKRKKKKFSVGN